MVQADIESINNADYFWIATESGGSGQAGRYIEISGSDSVQASIDGIRTKIVVEKSVSTGLPYTVGNR